MVTLFTFICTSRKNEMTTLGSQNNVSTVEDTIKTINYYLMLAHFLQQWWQMSIKIVCFSIFAQKEKRSSRRIK